MQDLDQIQLSKAELERFSRHLILPEIGLEGQKRLKAGSVLCIGTGGLGSPLLLYLAAAGVGHLGIVDFDVVDTSNLQRQVIHSTSTVGMPKVESAKQRILEINPFCEVTTYNVPLTSANALELFAEYDVVVDGTDNFPTRYLVNDACVLTGKPNVYGSIFRFEGQATVFNYQDGPNYRDLYPEPPPPGLVPSCAEGGVLGILPGIIGVIQATETVKILTGIGTTLSGRLLLYDALTMRFRELKLRRNPQTPPITQLIDYQEFCGMPQVNEAPTSDDIVEITPAELKARMDAGKDFVLIDVRNPNEYDICKIAGSHLVPLPDIEQGSGLDQVRAVLNGSELIVHCKSGIRSAKALRALKAEGIEGLNLQGGILAWGDAYDPSVPKY